MDKDSLLAKAKELPHEPGCYLMKEASGHEIYVGKAKDLRRRVSSYFQEKPRESKEQALIDNIDDFEHVVTESEIEAFLLESRLIKDLQPKYNVLLKHNEMYPYVEITLGEDFPRVLVTREHKRNKSRYFGPFTSATEVRACLTILGRIFKFRTCAKHIQAGDEKLRFERPCLNFHINRCTAPCAGKVGQEDYRKQIRGLALFFGGGKKELIEGIRSEMKVAAKKLLYESAAELRDCLQALESINSAPDLDEELAPAAPVIDPREGLESLREALGLTYQPRRIEGIDIANLQGKEMVGALVSFLDALPFKDGYRRFRIKTVAAQDDFACIHEVVTRRYSMLLHEGRDLPDIILIDGGKGQLASARDALDRLQVQGPVLMSLAKEEETPYRSGQEGPVALGKRSAGLRLLMYVRDEAHRFAQHYHHILRAKKLRD